jgi:hypothetical protein
MGTGLSVELSEQILLVACGRDVPAEVDFAEFLRIAQASEYRALWVHSAGGYYDAVQRKRAASAIGAAQQVAIMTDSMFARGAVTAFSWIVRGVRAFGGDAFADAQAYLGASHASERRLRSMIAALSRANERRVDPCG